MANVPDSSIETAVSKIFESRFQIRILPRDLLQVSSQADVSVFHSGSIFKFFTAIGEKFSIDRFTGIEIRPST